MSRASEAFKTEVLKSAYKKNLDQKFKSKKYVTNYDNETAQIKELTELAPNHFYFEPFVSIYFLRNAYIHKIFSFLLSLASKSLILTNLTMTKLLNRLTGLKVAQSCSNQIHILCMTMRQNRVGSILFRISIF